MAYDDDFEDIDDRGPTTATFYRGVPDALS
jgi:hypothetical protein